MTTQPTPARLPLDPLLVRMSPDLIAELKDDWSRPVQIKAERNADGTIELICRILINQPKPWEQSDPTPYFTLR